MRIIDVLLTVVLVCSIVVLPVSVPEANADSAADAAADAQDDDDVSRPEGWTEETHGKKADPNYEIVFPGNKVNRLDITITAADWQAMMDDMEQLWGPRSGSGGSSMGCGSSASQVEEEVAASGCNNSRPIGYPDENPVYKPCTMVFEGKTWYHVGIRFKGNSSLGATWGIGSYKLPLRITTDKFEDEFPEIDNQRFYGFQKLSLSSNWADNSLLHEKVAADIFRDAGVPAPHTAFYRVFIDYGEGSKYFGLYTMSEIPDKPMLENQFSDNGGNLYKPEGVSTSFAIYIEEEFDKENNEDEADYSDVRALYDAVNDNLTRRTNPALWRVNLEKALNVDGFLRWLAVNTTIQNWDTYGSRGHNYYLYNDPADTQLHWIPWDNNLALSGGPNNRALSLELTSREVGKGWPLIRYLIDDPIYHAKYVKYVGETITTTFYPDRMRPIYKAAHDLIRPYVVGDEGEVPGYTLLITKNAFDKGLKLLDQHVQDRFEAAQAFISKN
jgi:spore coat protein CotH